MTKQRKRRAKRNRKSRDLNADLYDDDDEDQRSKFTMTPDSNWRELQLQAYLKMRMRRGMMERRPPDEVANQSNSSNVTLAERIVRARLRQCDQPTEKDPSENQETSRNADKLRDLLHQYVRQRQTESILAGDLLNEIGQAKRNLRDEGIQSRVSTDIGRHSQALSLGDSASNFNMKNKELYHHGHDYVDHEDKGEAICTCEEPEKQNSGEDKGEIICTSEEPEEQNSHVAVAVDGDGDGVNKKQHELRRATGNDSVDTTDNEHVNNGDKPQLNRLTTSVSIEVQTDECTDSDEYDNNSKCVQTTSESETEQPIVKLCANTNEEEYVKSGKDNAQDSDLQPENNNSNNATTDDQDITTIINDNPEESKDTIKATQNNSKEKHKEAYSELVKEENMNFTEGSLNNEDNIHLDNSIQEKKNKEGEHKEGKERSVDNEDSRKEHSDEKSSNGKDDQEQELAISTENSPKRTIQSQFMVVSDEEERISRGNPLEVNVIIIDANKKRKKETAKGNKSTKGEESKIEFDDRRNVIDGTPSHTKSEINYLTDRQIIMRTPKEGSSKRVNFIDDRVADDKIITIKKKDVGTMTVSLSTKAANTVILLRDGESQTEKISEEKSTNVEQSQMPKSIETQTHTSTVTELYPENRELQEVKHKSNNNNKIVKGNFIYEKVTYKRQTLLDHPTHSSTPTRSKRSPNTLPPLKVPSSRASPNIDQQTSFSFQESSSGSIIESRDNLEGLGFESETNEDDAGTSFDGLDLRSQQTHFLPKMFNNEKYRCNQCHRNNGHSLNSLQCRSYPSLNQSGKFLSPSPIYMNANRSNKTDAHHYAFLPHIRSSSEVSMASGSVDEIMKTQTKSTNTLEQLPMIIHHKYYDTSSPRFQNSQSMADTVMKSYSPWTRPRKIVGREERISDLYTMLKDSNTCLHRPQCRCETCSSNGDNRTHYLDVHFEWGYMDGNGAKSNKRTNHISNRAHDYLNRRRDHMMLPSIPRDFSSNQNSIPKENDKEEDNLRKKCDFIYLRDVSFSRFVHDAVSETRSAKHYLKPLLENESSPRVLNTRKLQQKKSKRKKEQLALLRRVCHSRRTHGY